MTEGKVPGNRPLVRQHTWITEKSRGSIHLDSIYTDGPILRHILGKNTSETYQRYKIISFLVLLRHAMHSEGRYLLLRTVPIMRTMDDDGEDREEEKEPDKPWLLEVPVSPIRLLMRSRFDGCIEGFSLLTRGDEVVFGKYMAITYMYLCTPK